MMSPATSSVRDRLCVGDRGLASVVAVHLMRVPGDFAGHGPLAGHLEVIGLDDNMLVHGHQVLTLDDELGHRCFSYLMLFKATSPLLLRGRGGSRKFDSGSGCSISTVETLSSTDRTSDTSKSHR